MDYTDIRVNAWQSERSNAQKCSLASAEFLLASALFCKQDLSVWVYILLITQFEMMTLSNGNNYLFTNKLSVS
jgi:hypothetical protein